MSHSYVLQQRFDEQEQELRVHQIELEQQNEELRQINVELELARSGYADLFESAPVGYVVCDAAGLIQQINKTGCAQLGAECAQLVGRPFAQFIQNGGRAAFAELLRSVLLPAGLADVHQSLELKMAAREGRPWDAQLGWLSLAGPEGPLIRLVLTDVTEMKNTQRELERRTRQAQDLTQELQTFLHAMTHDLTRPLRQVEGFAGLLGKSLRNTDPKSADHLKHLLLAASQMGALTTSLTRFFQSGQPDRRPQTLDLNRMIDGIVHDLKPEMAGRQVHLTHDVLPSLQGDRLGLQMVFSNLLSNAVKFTRPRAEARIHVGVQEQPGAYLFSVQDNGVGYDPGQSGRLFGLFQRLHSERDFEGQGLGLALARRIVEHSDGQIWAENVQGEGSVFWVRLPRASETEQSDPEA